MPPDDAAKEELWKTRRAFVLALVAVFGILSYFVFAPFLSYVFMGGLFVYLAHPLYRRLNAKLKRPALSALLVLGTILALLIAPLVWLSWEVVGTVSTISAASGEGSVHNMTFSGIRKFYAIAGLPPPTEHEIETMVAGAISKATSYLQEHAPDLVVFVGDLLIGIFIMAFVIYYGLIDGEALLKYLISASPLDDDQDRLFLGEIRKTVDAVFLGHIIVSFIQGALGGIGFLVFGVPNAIFWGFVMIILSLIPMVGAFLVWAPAGAWMLATGNTVGGIGVLVWGAVVVSTIDNFLRPKIVGARADIHPVFVLVGVLGGLVAFGFIGFVLGPLVLALFVAVLNFWREDYLPAYTAAHEGAGPQGGESPPPPTPPARAAEPAPQEAQG